MLDRNQRQATCHNLIRSTRPRQWLWVPAASSPRRTPSVIRHLGRVRIPTCFPFLTKTLDRRSMRLRNPADLLAGSPQWTLGKVERQNLSNGRSCSSCPASSRLLPRRRLFLLLRVSPRYSSRCHQPTRGRRLRRTPKSSSLFGVCRKQMSTPRTPSKNTASSLSTSWWAPL